MAERLSDILGCIDRCHRYANFLGAEDPSVAAMAMDAVERNLQIIGEASNHLPSEFVIAHPEIPWAQIRGFRNILVHQYFGVDEGTVREVVEKYLPPLAKALQKQ